MLTAIEATRVRVRVKGREGVLVVDGEQPMDLSEAAGGDMYA